MFRSEVPSVYVRSALFLVLLAGGCSRDTGTDARQADTLVHLAARLDAATVTSGGADHETDAHSWTATDGLPEWSALAENTVSRLAAVGLEQVPDAVRVTLSRAPTSSWVLVGGLRIGLDPALRLADWEAVLVKARSSDRFGGITATYNTSGTGAIPGDMQFFQSADGTPPVFSDGSEQVYAIPLAPREGDEEETRIRDLAVVLGTPETATIDILEITLVPRGAGFPGSHGARPVTRNGETRDTLYARTPARLEWNVDLPAGARLDLGLTAAAGEGVRYRVLAGDNGLAEPVLDRTVSGATDWEQVSVDLAAHGGRRTRLTLEAESDSPGAIALWGAPILTGATHSLLPNVIFYVIDGAGADLMSLYGYEQPTTPFLEELAAEGTVFERAYANSTWTQPSTVSFMTSLHHSVLGGLRRGVHSTPVPPGATTMAERFRDAGYQTASFGSNPNAGRLIGLERGVDLLRDAATEHHSTSSADLHAAYWAFREAYPAQPYWAHFQTTDVHEPNQPRPPFAGRLVEPQRRGQLMQWDMRLYMAGGHLFGTTSIQSFYDEALRLAGIDRRDYFELRRDLYNETMMHQDAQLRRLVERLKERGEWENTLLVIASDHGHPAGTFARFGRGLLDPQPDAWQGALFDAYSTRVPMLWIWPGTVPAGQRLTDPVSMIDVLPTLTDLVGLAVPEVLQGQSLAPLLRGEAMDVRPVVLDEFRVDEATGELVGNLEIVDGRWGASLEIRSRQPAGDTGRHEVPFGGRWGARHPSAKDAPRLLLYDLEADPFATRAVNEQYPDLVARYRRLLLQQWKAHLALARSFAGEIDDVPLTPDQLEQLKALGYIQ